MTSHDNALPITLLLPETAAGPQAVPTRRHATLRTNPDCNVEEQVPANPRAIKQPLRKYGYPPTPNSYYPATDLILRKAEVIADGAVA